MGAPSGLNQGATEPRREGGRDDHSRRGAVVAA